MNSFSESLSQESLSQESLSQVQPGTTSTQETLLSHHHRFQKRSLFIVMGVLICLLLVSSSFSRNAGTSGDVEPGRQLLEEVRLLRQALERSNSTMPAFHVLLERTRLQNEIVGQRDQQIHDAQLEAERSRLETEQILHRIEDLKEHPPQNSNSESQIMTENEIKELRVQADQQKQRAELYRQQLDRLTLQMTQEQIKLDNLNSELDKLQVELTLAPKSK